MWITLKICFCSAIRFCRLITTILPFGLFKLLSKQYITSTLAFARNELYFCDKKCKSEDYLILKITISTFLSACAFILPFVLRLINYDWSSNDVNLFYNSSFSFELAAFPFWFGYTRQIENLKEKLRNRIFGSKGYINVKCLITVIFFLWKLLGIFNGDIATVSVSYFYFDGYTCCTEFEFLNNNEFDNYLKQFNHPLVFGLFNLSYIKSIEYFIRLFPFYLLIYDACGDYIYYDPLDVLTGLDHKVNNLDEERANEEELGNEEEIVVGESETESNIYNERWAELDLWLYSTQYWESNTGSGSVIEPDHALDNEFYLEVGEVVEEEFLPPYKEEADEDTPPPYQE